jgi:hypothetical protein
MTGERRKKGEKSVKKDIYKEEIDVKTERENE